MQKNLSTKSDRGRNNFKERCSWLKGLKNKKRTYRKKSSKSNWESKDKLKKIKENSGLKGIFISLMKGKVLGRANRVIPERESSVA